MTSHRKSAAGVLACFLVLLSSACGTTSGQIVLQRHDRLSLFASASNPVASADAAIEGALTLNPDSCLGLGSGHVFRVVIFPYGTRWFGSDHVWVDGSIKKIGQTVTLGGGVTEDKQTLATVAQTCPSASTSSEVFAAG